MSFDPEIHHRRSIRLRGYDYSLPGRYFTTLCAHEKKCLFGEVVEGQMVLNEPGKLIEEIWRAMPGRFTRIELDAFVVMPNHIHMILNIVGAPLAGARFGRGQAPPLQGSIQTGKRPAPTVGDVIGAFKSISTIAVSRMTPSAPIGRSGKLRQRNYFDHIIRDEWELGKIREHIQTNPLRWAFDRENPQT